MYTGYFYIRAFVLNTTFLDSFDLGLVQFSLKLNKTTWQPFNFSYYKNSKNQQWACPDWEIMFECALSLSCTRSSVFSVPCISLTLTNYSENPSINPFSTQVAVAASHDIQLFLLMPTALKGDVQQPSLCNDWITPTDSNAKELCPTPSASACL